ncbi:MAG: DUF3263 domain-containing protein [Acidimicrobiia bacterium]|nr:DUF3263 domain-containing protein [Acidimicrobiia bacterium]
MLDDFSRSALDFERTWWLLPGHKHANIADQLGCTSAEYYETLAALADDPAAKEYDPLTVARLRRIKNHPAGTAIAP